MTSSDGRSARGGFGAQTHGSRKGLGGDPPNAAVKGAAAQPSDKATEAQIADMQSEGQGQTQATSVETRKQARPRAAK